MSDVIVALCGAVQRSLVSSPMPAGEAPRAGPPAPARQRVPTREALKAASVTLRPTLTSQRQNAPSIAADPPTPRAEPRGATAQVAAATTEAAARKELASLGTLESTLDTRVEQVAVNGAILYRALVVGFPTRKAARQFCDLQHRSPKDCWVR